MNYLGSKKKLSFWIKESILSVIGEKKFKLVDIFAGTGKVSEILKDNTEKIIMNDFQLFLSQYLKKYLYDEISHKKSEFIGNYILNFKVNKDYENHKFVELYGNKYFSKNNAIKIAKIIEIIKKIDPKNIEIIDLLKYLVLQSADKVQNCSSTYGAYFKYVKESAKKDLILKSEYPPQINHLEILNENSDELIEKLDGDVLYMDPPYNGRQYQTNYHVLNTIARWNFNFIPEGKTLLSPKEWRANSNWCSKNKVVEYFTKYLDSKFNFIILSYNDEGFLKETFIREQMKKRGEYILFKKEYNKFKSNKNVNRKNVIESLHILKK